VRLEIAGGIEGSIDTPGAVEGPVFVGGEWGGTAKKGVSAVWKGA
jgi:hypothetical protein